MTPKERREAREAAKRMHYVAEGWLIKALDALDARDELLREISQWMDDTDYDCDTQDGQAIAEKIRAVLGKE